MIAQTIKAKKSDYKIILSMLKASGLWSQSRGINHWQEWISPSRQYKDWVKQGCAGGEFFICHDNEQQILGIYRLIYSDITIWGEKNDKSGYVHSFTTNRDRKGAGIGYIMLDNISKRLKDEGMDYLRLDCRADNPGLIKFYQGYGFCQKGIVEIADKAYMLHENKL